MKSDLVERAAAVVRERYDGHSTRAAAAEGRVLHALEATRARRRWQLAVMVPLLATLLASGAWAAVGEGMRARLRSAVARSSVLGAAPSSGARRASGEPLGGNIADSAASPRNDAPAPTAEAPRSVPADEAQFGSAARVSRVPARSQKPASLARASRAALEAPAGSVSAPPIPSAESHAPEMASNTEPEALFRAAQRAQFTERDPARALELWDRYLTAAPNGSLSPEARYNRAIDLARLGRKAQAVQALEPFARGDYGPYRQAEARALVNALSAPP